MGIFERFHNKFGQLYDGLFGAERREISPKDILRKIFTEMEDNSKEGFDGKIYAPNKYILELAVADLEERNYILSFLDEDELKSVLERFMEQNGYYMRGPLDFTIAEVPELERAGRSEKLIVKARFEKAITTENQSIQLPKPEPQYNVSEPLVPAFSDIDDLPTVPRVDFAEDDLETIPAVAWASLAITAPDGRKRLFSLTHSVVPIGRSRIAGNPLVLDGDGMVSKSHARIERERDGRFTIYDLGSMNGVIVNGVTIDSNRTLADGDEILIGSTKLVFQQDKPEENIPVPKLPEPQVTRLADAIPRRARLVSQDGLEYVLASETLIGRAITCDIVLDAPSVSTKHARIIAPDLATYYLEDLDSDRGSAINGRLINSRQRSLLADGDILTLGEASLRFVAGVR
jgi:pSer/pThr/pTyr-binding forkhead associated (FHA) protein